MWANSVLSATGLVSRARASNGRTSRMKGSKMLRSKSRKLDEVLQAVQYAQVATQGLLMATLQLALKFLAQLQHFLGIVCWVGLLYGNIWAAFLGILALPSWFALAILTTQAALILLPLGDTPPPWADRLLRFSISSAVHWFPIRLHIEDPAALTPDRPYIVAFEPHSALPLAMAGVFCKHSGLLPPALENIHTLASSAVFFVPGLRHAWYWLGMRPVSKKVMSSILGSGGSVALCPGGVQECLHMQHGEEAVYLRKRFGFVRLAMQTGAAVLPTFGFGQTDMYNFIKPGPPVLPKRVVAALARMIGFLPLIIYGVKGTPLPRQVPVDVVMGAPLIVAPDGPIANPTNEQVQEQLDRFIRALEELVQTQKGKYGHPNLKLTVY